MNRREAAERLDQIRTMMARAGQYRHLSGWAAIINGLLVCGACALCKWVLDVSFRTVTDHRVLALVWAPVAVLALGIDIVFTVTLARRRGDPAWSPSARHLVAGLVPGLYVGTVLTVSLVLDEQYDALPGAWMVSYGAALMGASLFAPWEVRYFGLALLLLGGVALVTILRNYPMWMMGLGFGVMHLVFGAYVLWRYRGEGRAAPAEGEDDDKGESGDPWRGEGDEDD